MAAKDYEEVTSPGYGSMLLDKLRLFREEGLLCDYTLKVENETFQVHRAVLAGFSDYFRAMFSHNMIEQKNNSLELKSLAAAGVRPLLDYAYTGTMHLSLDSIQDILEASSFLQITTAIEACVNYLKSKMTFENADRLVSLGENYGVQELAEYRRTLILKKFLEFAKTDTFLQLDAKTLACYLKEDHLETTTEGKLLKCALRWYNYDKENREKDVYEVLDKIRFTLDGWPTIEYASRQEPFTTNSRCKELIEFAECYMQKAARKHLQQSHRTRVRYHKKTLVQMGGNKGAPCNGFLDELPDYDVEHSGCGSNHYYHHDLKVWFPLGVIGTSDFRSHCPLVEVNDFGILCGGYVYSSDFETTYQHFSNEVKLFTPGGFALWDMNYMQEARAHHVVVHVPGYLYAVGGKNDTGALATVERYDLDTEKWEFVKCLLRSMFDHAGAAHQDKIYVSGGVQDGAVSDQLMRYDPQEHWWEEGPPMLTARTGHTMTKINDQLIVCGGKSDMQHSRCLASVESYNLELNQWTYLTPMRKDCSAMSAVVLDDKLLVVGGEDSVKDVLNLIQEYDPQTDKWGVYGYLPFPLKELGCCAVTIKLTKDGQEETDSLADAYEAKFQDVFEVESDEYPYYDHDVPELYINIEYAGLYDYDDDELDDNPYESDMRHWPRRC